MLKNVILFLLFWFASASDDNIEYDDFVSITGKSPSENVTKAKSILKELKARENLFSHNLLPANKRQAYEAEPVFTKGSLLFHSLSANYKGLAVPWWDEEFPLQLSYQGILYSLKFCTVHQEEESVKENEVSYTVTKNVLSIVYQSEFHSVILAMKDPVRKTHAGVTPFETIVDWNRGNKDKNVERKTSATHNNLLLDDVVVTEILESSPKFDLKLLKQIWENIDMSESNQEVTRLRRSAEAARAKASTIKRFYFLFFIPFVLGSLFTANCGDSSVCLSEFGPRQVFGLIYFIIASLYLGDIMIMN